MTVRVRKKVSRGPTVGVLFSQVRYNNSNSIVLIVTNDSELFIAIMIVIIESTNNGRNSSARLKYFLRQGRLPRCPRRRCRSWAGGDAALERLE